MATITINCSTPESRIYYTLDGSIPTESSNLYSEPFELNSTTTIKSKAFKEGYNDSDINSLKAYTISYEWVGSIGDPVCVNSEINWSSYKLNLGVEGNTYYIIYNAGVPTRIDISAVNETTQEPIELTSPTLSEDGVNFYLSFVMPSSSAKITAKYHNSAN